MKKILKCFILTTTVLIFFLNSDAFAKVHPSFFIIPNKLKWEIKRDKSNAHDTKWIATLAGHPYAPYPSHYVILLKIPPKYIHHKHRYFQDIKAAVLSGDLNIYTWQKGYVKKRFLYHDQLPSHFKLRFLSHNVFKINGMRFHLINVPANTPLMSTSAHGALVLMTGISPFKITY